ncbi:hypothetical protein [Virgibacillus ndiopensis]|uniref:hypothetical protein n=1 Tax=Virgibacillus ndiopensis TaxID=2004408 RepID=UPI00159BD6B2|nr:hypothetical protein [Virgibacillus ndiopensis]
MLKKNPVTVIIIICLIIAGLIDLKNRGLFFRLLPTTIQDYLVDKGITKNGD